MTPSDREKWLKAVFAEMDKLTGRTLHPRYGMLYSPAEYDLARRWCDRGLTLATVLQGIRETGGTPKTLMACERSVEASVARQAQAVPEKHPLLEPISMEGWDPAKEKARIYAKYGR